MTAQASLARTQLLLRVLAVAVLLTWIAAAHGVVLGLYSAAALAFAGQVARFEDCSHHAITITAKDICQADLRAGFAAAARG